MLPIFSFADTATHEQQLVSLYTQLILLLQREVAVLRNAASPSLSISTPYGYAPLLVVYSVNNPSGKEAIDFGDGHSSGSNGCMMNSYGFCDLSKALSHTYQLPGTYTVTLYGHQSKDAHILATTTITAALNAEK